MIGRESGLVDGDRQFVEALARGIRILNCFTAQRPSLTATEIKRLTGLPQPTVFRLCYTLTKCGLIKNTGFGGKFTLGLQVLSLGQAALAGAGFNSVVADELKHISLKYHLAASIAVKEGHEMLIVQRAHGDGELLLNLQIGSKLEMATSTFGIAYLCTVGPAERGSLLRQLEEFHGDKWPAVYSKIQEMLTFFETNGYVKSISFLKPGLSSIAMPIYCEHIKSVLVLNCGGPSVGFDDKVAIDELLEDMRTLGKHIRAMAASGIADAHGSRLFQR
jgi:DNA-binding IclR family transcriptional regulator